MAEIQQLGSRLDKEKGNSTNFEQPCLLKSRHGYYGGNSGVRGSFVPKYLGTAFRIPRFSKKYFHVPALGWINCELSGMLGKVL
jgi:hypothetical protein